MKRLTLTALLLSSAACADLSTIRRVEPLQATYGYNPPQRVVVVDQYGQPVPAPRSRP